jgi:hypothetical protein
MNITFADEATGEERLRQLLRVVEAAPDERFNMIDFSLDVECGTAYCAAGWAALDPWFRENTPIGEVLRVLETDGGPVLVQEIFLVFPALADIFGLDQDNADALFGASLALGDVVEKSAVVENIRSLLNGGEAWPYKEDHDEDDDFKDDEDDDL